MKRHSFFTQSANRFYAILFVLLLTFSGGLYAQNEKSVSSKEGMTATAHPLATKAAQEMLSKGGNAVDAAVAAAFAIGVVEPDGSGLGGGGGMVIYLNKLKKSVFINYYQCASKDVANSTFKLNVDKNNAKTILVPGTTAGLLAALEKYGTLPRSVVLGPAIRYAKEGYPIDETLSKIILDNSTSLQGCKATAANFLPEGFPLGQGDTLRQPELAVTLTKISDLGKKGFYEGDVAKQIVDEVNAEGGVMTMEDLSGYEPVISEPVRGSYRGYTILSTPAPLSGTSVLEALNIVENVDLGSWGHFSTSAKSLHLLAETFKRVSSDRSSYLGDPRYSTIPTKGLLSKDFAKDRFASIDLTAVNPPRNADVKSGNVQLYNKTAPKQKPVEAKEKSVKQQVDAADDVDDNDNDINSSSQKNKNPRFDYWGKQKVKSTGNPVNVTEPEVKDTSDKVNDQDKLESLLNTENNQELTALTEPIFEGGHTTHLCVADKEGNMVSLTQTLGNFFGSGVSAAGVLLNNGMVNFSANSDKNKIEPGKRPRSSISPTIILDKEGKPWIAIGSPGAGRIIPTVAQLIMNIIDFKMSINDANLAPRMYSQKFDENLYVESRVTPQVRETLEKMGHKVVVYGDFDLFFGGAQIIMFDSATGLFYGSADPRRGGTAGGD
ncbi:MAG: gamma-glutamyltransferase family protein [Ignavibacteria bacterium]|nr:gamma-glutamyltransferase family protein [Ignavibacteria bacterium]